MTEVTSCYTECTHFYSDYSEIPSVALQWRPREDANLPRFSWTATSFLAGILLTSAGKLHSLNVGGEHMLRPQKPCPCLEGYWLQLF